MRNTEQNPKELRGRARTSYIKKELKAVFPETKFSVRSDHSSIDLSWTDGPTEDMVREIGIHKLYESRYGRYFFYGRNYSPEALLASRIAAAQIIDHEMEKQGRVLQTINERAWRVFRNTDLYTVDAKEIKDIKIEVTHGAISGMTFNTTF